MGEIQLEGGRVPGSSPAGSSRALCTTRHCLSYGTFLARPLLSDAGVWLADTCLGALKGCRALRKRKRLDKEPGGREEVSAGPAQSETRHQTAQALRGSVSGDRRVGSCVRAPGWGSRSHHNGPVNRHAGLTFCTAFQGATPQEAKLAPASVTQYHGFFILQPRG